jgi:ankyrin repeat protein
MHRLCTYVLIVVLLPPVLGLAAGRAVPIVAAARNGDIKTLRTLLARGLDVNATEPDGSTALHWAADRGDVVAVDLLLRRGANPSMANRYGVTPLALAAGGDNAAVIGLLLKAGAGPNVTLAGGETALMTAARAGRLDVVRALAEAGANVNAAEGTRGQTALMWAAAEGHADVIRLLIQKGAAVNATSRGPSSPKDITDGDSIYKRVAPRVDIFTSLQFAVQGGHLAATTVLLDSGAHVGDETPQGMGLLTLAIANAHFDVAGLLIERGADVNQAKIGWAPLHQVARVRTLNIGQFPHPQPTGSVTSLDVAKLLLAHGATVDARTTKPWQDGWRGSFGLNATPFLIAAKGADVQMMWLLAANGANVTATNANGTTALMATAGVEMFNPNEDSGTDADALAALKVALTLGAGDINAVNAAGDFAIHGAIHRPSTDLLKFLIDHGAKLDVKNKRGMTPIQLAVNGVGVGMGQRPDAVALLRAIMLARGMDPDIKEDPNRYKFGVKEVDVSR